MPSAPSYFSDISAAQYRERARQCRFQAAGTDGPVAASLRKRAAQYDAKADDLEADVVRVELAIGSVRGENIVQTEWGDQVRGH